MRNALVAFCREHFLFVTGDGQGDRKALVTAAPEGAAVAWLDPHKQSRQIFGGLFTK